MSHCVTVRLHELCELLTDGTHYTPPISSEGLPFLTVKDLSDDGIDFANCGRITQLEFDKAARANCVAIEGDVLFSKDGTVGKVQLVGTGQRVAVLSSLAILRVDRQRLNPRYLAHYLRTPTAIAAAERRKTGTAIRRVILTDLRDLQIPVVPISLQHRIADVLDKADSIRRKRKEAIAFTEELLRSAFLAMFGDPVTNSRSWPVRLLGNLGELDRGRSRHRPRNDPALLGGRHPLIQTGEVANSDGLIRSYAQTYSDYGLAQSKIWPTGTLCITIAANIAKTGVLAFDACFPDSVVGFTPGPDATNEYIQYWMSFLQPILERQAPQVAQKNINLEILRLLGVPTPPLRRQLEFSQFVSKVRRTRVGLHSALESAEALFCTLADRAFRGKLTC